MNVEEPGQSLLELMRGDDLTEIFISVTFPSQPAIHNFVRDFKVQVVRAKHGHPSGKRRQPHRAARTLGISKKTMDLEKKRSNATTVI